MNYLFACFGFIQESNSIIFIFCEQLSLRLKGWYYLLKLVLIKTMNTLLLLNFINVYKTFFISV